MNKHYGKARWSLIAVAAALLVLGAWKGPQWLAFKDGVQAYLYGYPLVTAGMTKKILTAPVPPGGRHRMGSGPMNQLSNTAEFPDYHFTDVVSPNADTLYSISWLDLSKGPMVLHTPDMGQRWLLMEVLDAWANAFASLGTRVYGHAPHDYVIVGPGWNGTLPQGMVRVDCPTRIAWLLGRTYTAGKADYAAVHAIQAQYTLTPLSSYGQPYSPPAPSTVVDPSIDTQTPVVTQVAQLDAAQYFGRLARLMRDNPPAPGDAKMVAKLAKLGITPGKPFHYDALSPAQRRGLDDAVWFAKGLFDARSRGSQGNLQLTSLQRRFFAATVVALNRLLMNTHNGWQVPLNLGIYGNHYALRAIATLVGYGANIAKDAVYTLASVDANGDALNGAHRYRLHFNKDQLPPAGNFWSLSMYNEKGYFIENSIGRYALGDRDALKFQSDGSIDFLIQHDAPDIAEQSNWLPAPAGNFRLILRLYGPKATVLDGTWVPPAIERQPD
jgi:hypothetical protein